MTIKHKFSFRNPNQLKPLVRYDPRVHGVRQSMLDTWMSCREKARLSIVQGWRDKAASMPLIYGSLSHGVLKQVYRGLRDGSITEIDTVYKALELFIGESEADWRRECPMPTSLQEVMMEEACAILTKKLPWYFYKWWEDDTTVKWSMVEDKFMIPMQMDDGEIVPLIGTFDATFKKDSGLWLFETKNKSRWGDDIGTYLPLDLQVGIYTTALSVLYNESPAGIRYNILRRPSERRKKEEGLVEFSDRIATNVEGDPEHYFFRMDIELTTAEKDEHIKRTEALIQAFYNWWKETEQHPDERDLLWNSGSCDGKYGVCKMLTACANKDFTPYRREDPTVAAGNESYE
jgi:hypothetical protein